MPTTQLLSQRQLPAPDGAGPAPEAEAAERDFLRIDTEFDDVRLILRRWQSVRPASGGLPQYEEMALGSVGRFADEMAVVRQLEGDEPVILRAGAALRGDRGRALRRLAWPRACLVRTRWP